MTYYEAIEIMENAHHHSMVKIREASKVIDEMIKKAEKFDEIFHNYFEASKE